MKSRPVRVGLFLTALFALSAVVGAASPSSSQESPEGLGGALTQKQERATSTQRSCASLLSLTDVQFSIVEAHVEPASEDAPEHCRLYGSILLDIRFAVFLPTDWNGRLSMSGNGGWAGSIPERWMRAALREGSVSVGTDTGHGDCREPGVTFALDR